HHRFAQSRQALLAPASALTHLKQRRGLLSFVPCGSKEGCGLGMKMKRMTPPARRIGGAAVLDSPCRRSRARVRAVPLHTFPSAHHALGASPGLAIGVGAALLLAGRKLFWFFVAAVGFVAAME